MKLSASNISFSAGANSILKNMSIEIQPGTFTAVVGPNGAGKSTLLKILSGDSKPTKGEVKLLDRSLASFRPKELAKIRSVLSQHTEVAFSFTVEEVIGLGLHIHRLTKMEIEGIVREVLQETGIDHLRKRLYPTLSGGERQRVQLARALAQIWEGTLHPRFLLLDEPTNNLDLAHQHAILFTARTMLRKNLGVLAIVHDLNLAAQYADYILFVKGGTLHAEGVPYEIMKKEIIEEVFQHPVNILYGDRGPFVMALPYGYDDQLHNQNTLIQNTVHG